MNKESINETLKSFWRSVTKNAPTILTAIGGVGAISVGVLTTIATVKAVKQIEEKKKEENRDELTKSEIVKEVWPLYIPPVLSTAATIACGIGSRKIDAKRQSALIAAYAISEKALTDYHEAVHKVVNSKKKESEILHEVNEKNVKNDPVSGNKIVVTGNGDSLCKDSISRQYFYSNIESIKYAINKLDYRMQTEHYISLNDFYDELGLEHLGAGVGDDIGFSFNYGLISDSVYFDYVAADDGRPCIVIAWRPGREPRAGYTDF